jgi:O-antigen/teichoic acid export membrane protein
MSAHDPEAPSPAPGAGAARNALHLLLGQAGTTALSILLNAILARALGAAEFGVLFFVAATASFAYVLVEWGQDSYVVREVARRPARAGELLGTTLAMRVAGGALACAPTVLVAGLLGHDSRTLVLTAAMVAATLPVVLARAYGVVFRGRERMDVEAAVSVLAKGLALVLTAAALALGGRTLSAVLAQGLAAAAVLPVAGRLVRRLRLPRPRLSRAVARELVVGGTPFAVMVLTISAQGYLEAVVLSALAPAAVVGWYGAARTVTNALVTPASLLATAVLPRLARTASAPAELQRELRSALRPLLGLGSLAAVGTWLFADVAVDLVYGASGFRPAATLLRAFAPVLPLFTLDVLLGNAVMVVRPARLALVKALAIVLTIGLDVLLVPVCQARFGNGALGLILGFAAGEVLMVTAAAMLLPPRTLHGAFWRDLLRATVAGAGTLAPFALLPEAPPAVAMPACVVVFAALSWGVGLLRREDVASLRAPLRP